LVLANSNVSINSLLSHDVIVYQMHIERVC